MEPVVELSQPGVGGESLEFKVSKITPQTVVNAFRVSGKEKKGGGRQQRVSGSNGVFALQLDPQTVWLIQKFGRRCYFPDQDGQFNFDHEVGDTVCALTVEGALMNLANETASPATTNPNQPYYKRFGNKKEGTCNVKVVKANMNKLPNGKVEFERLEQTHISIDDRSANVHTVNSAVQGATFVVTGDGLEVYDSSGTQGMCSVCGLPPLMLTVS